ncbi:MAG TPA: hypothetical protein VKT32_04860 [Chthonomonadaceae bacterium]|nr:hypothetical protein [Chthonomonadaceae bacterium]
MDADSKPFINQLLAEIRRLNEQMRNDQAEIERLKLETPAISAHTDQLLLQIEAQLDALSKAA